MQAIWNDRVIAEADKKDLIYIEGNWYFPPESIRRNYLKPNDEQTTCFWKGEASYYDIDVDGNINKSGAWYYAEPIEGSAPKVGKDFSNYVAFWRGVAVKG